MTALFERPIFFSTSFSGFSGEVFEGLSIVIALYTKYKERYVPRKILTT